MGGILLGVNPGQRGECRPSEGERGDVRRSMPGLRQLLSLYLTSSSEGGAGDDFLRGERSLHWQLTTCTAAGTSFTIAGNGVSCKRPEATATHPSTSCLDVETPIS